MPIRIAKNVSITPELDHFISTQIASGRYQNASEVMRAALRLLERWETAESRKRARLAERTSRHA
ncbi:type II toxin-antitoxin system ParD family antitoxin [Methylobacterium nodulans]|uniref:Putative addiction module antidote protein, CopG/Arc/MetJ family n=1 Tax=Methylobacterium nodulans (strain LMG 21967 / CNCM I-2342 / ORS 2060) TaxID=460265 RepID=B8IVG7_METNO|nr:type II toxin-antitoxin system ParD family antitoxin [Methylobacterium nodulans]ACL61018.1 putative addiction module antidote protein, CopG/Arc/MetJ family [Methylobacterium nodulans ORS 2060]